MASLTARRNPYILGYQTRAYSPRPTVPTTQDTNLYLDPVRGNDTTGDGSKTAPYKTLGKAQTVIRALDAATKAAGVCVWLRGGTHRRTATWTLAGASGDSGVGGAPIVWRGYPGEQAIISGGVALSGWTQSEDTRIPESARGRVWECSLTDNGITDLGTIPESGWGKAANVQAPEVFFRGEAMHLARYPNTGWSTITAAAAGNAFVYDEDDRPASWTGIDATQLRVTGYWNNNYGKSREKVYTLDTATHTVTTVSLPSGDYAAPGAVGGGKFYWENLLEELDAPGEYYIERASGDNQGKLYLYSEDRPGAGEVEVSIQGDNYLLTLNGLQNVTFKDIVFENCRKGGLYFYGASRWCRVDGCTIRNIGTIGLLSYDCKDLTVYDCEISACGHTAVQFESSSATSLIPTNNRLEECEIWDPSRNGGLAATQIFGVKNILRKNLFRDCPQAAVHLRGCQSVVELNDFLRVCTDVGDVGAVVSEADWFRANIIRWNRFRDIVASCTGAAKAIMMDDGSSYNMIYQNAFLKGGGHYTHVYGGGVEIGGGRGNEVWGNLAIDMADGVYRLDARYAAGNWAEASLSILQTAAASHNYTTGDYAACYPDLANVATDDPSLPKYNVLRNNARIRLGADDKDAVYFAPDEGAEDYYTLTDNWDDTAAAAGLISYDGLKVVVAADSPIASIVAAIPWERIGRGAAG